MVERYSMSIQGPFDRDPAELEPDNDGDWVRHDDYAALKAENERLTARATAFENMLRQAEADLTAERAGGEAMEAAHGVVEAFRFTAMKSEQLRAYHALIRALRGDAS